MPGAAFHITARTQGKEPWFKPIIRAQIEEIIIEGIATSDATLLAHTVMKNHFHIVLKQGSRPLGWIMQPIMRRTALLVQRFVGMEGHVFERKYRSHLCWNPDYLRRAIVYTHLNPVRAHICQAPEDYLWSSHLQLTTSSDMGDGAITVRDILKLFANDANASPEQLRDDYLNYVAWRLKKDMHDAAGIPFGTPEPESRAGDKHYMECFCSVPVPPRALLMDLRDKAMGLLLEIDSTTSIERLRVRTLPRRLCAVRKQLIAALLQIGYRCKCIADFFRVSDTLVSAIATEMRYGRLGLNRIRERGPLG